MFRGKTFLYIIIDHRSKFIKKRYNENTRGINIDTFQKYIIYKEMKKYICLDIVICLNTILS